MKRVRLSEFPGGWVIGNFSPSISVQRDVEVAIKSFRAGDKEPRHWQKVATEATFVISGVIRLGGHELQAGDGLVIPPEIAASFEALEDGSLVAIKWPSIPDDKVLCE